MKKKKKKQSALGIALSTAFVWFGGEMGAGTASGANSMNFFVKAGWIGIWLCFIATIAQIWYIYWGNEYSRLYNTHTYAKFASSMWGKMRKIMVPVVDTFMVMCVPVYFGGKVSGVASEMEQYFHMNYQISYAIVLVVFLLIALGGIALIRRFSTTVLIAVVISIVVILCICIPNFWPHIVEVQKERMMGDGYSYLRAVWLALAAWGQQAMNINSHVTSNTGLKTRKSLLICAVTDVFLLTLIKGGMTVMLSGRWPQNLSASIYILDATAAAGSTVIAIVYPIILACCLINGGILELFVNTSRWSDSFIWKNADRNGWTYQHRFLVTGICFIVINMLFSFFDFNFITGVLQVAAAYICLFVFGIPVSVICPIKVHKARKILMENGIDPSKEITPEASALLER